MSNRRNLNQPLTATEVVEFWKRTTKHSVGPDDCWEWTGLTQKIGGTNQVPYGVYLRPNNGEQLHAHRFAKMIELGAWDSIGVDPTGRGKRKLLVIHQCGNHTCCNPRHLTLGNYADKIEAQRRLGTLKAKGYAGPRRTYVYPSFEQAMMIWDGLISCKDAKDKWGLHPQSYYRYRNAKPDPTTYRQRVADPNGERRKAAMKIYNAAYRAKQKAKRNDPKREGCWWIPKYLRVGRTAIQRRVLNHKRKR